MVTPVTSEYLEDGQAHILQGKNIPPNVTILRIHGPFLFGTTAKLTEATEDLTQFKSVVILRLRNMTALDATGIHALEQFFDLLHKSGSDAHRQWGARNQPSQLIVQAPAFETAGELRMCFPTSRRLCVAPGRLRQISDGVGHEVAIEIGHSTF